MASKPCPVTLAIFIKMLAKAPKKNGRPLRMLRNRKQKAWGKSARIFFFFCVCSFWWQTYHGLMASMGLEGVVLFVLVFFLGG